MLRGKYRNQKEVVKTFGHDEKGQPTINGKRILTFNIEKMLPKKEVTETMKKSELKEIIAECFAEVLLENKSAQIKKEYAALKKMGKKALDAEYQRVMGVSTPSGGSKDELASDLVRSQFGDKAVAAAFGLSEGKYTDEELHNMFQDETWKWRIDRGDEKMLMKKFKQWKKQNPDLAPSRLAALPKLDRI